LVPTNIMDDFFKLFSLTHKDTNNETSMATMGR
jgi:hypothetical protein